MDVFKGGKDGQRTFKDKENTLIFNIKLFTASSMIAFLQ